jgi:hypothetical protein
METWILHPENKEQLNALKGIPFEKKKELTEREKTIKLYGKDMVEAIEKAEENIKAGKYKTFDTSKSLDENLTIWENTK